MNSGIISIKKVNSPYFNKSEYVLFRCKQCKSRFFNNSGVENNLIDFYENNAENKIKSDTRLIGNKYWNKQKKKIIKLLEKQPISVLDIGCRTGDFLCQFNDSIIREGVEISPKYSKLAENKGLKVYNESIENIDFTKRYNIISAYAVLEHLINPLTILQKLSTIINKDGILVILIPTHQCLLEKILFKISIRWHMYSPPEHLNFFSREYLDNYLKTRGFILKKRYYTSGGFFYYFKRFKNLNIVFKGISSILDRTPIRYLPIFDHMYSYYKKK